MERELLITGIGGQGVQLAGQVLARAATLEGRYVMLFGLYGGMMRGGNTDGTVVIGDEPLLTPPIVSRSWSAIAMHDEFWEPIEPKLRPGALVLVNDTTFTHEIAVPCEVHRVDATGIATELGHPLGGSMVMAGAYAGLTGIVGADALVEAMRQSIPSYRTQHIVANEGAIRAGLDAVEAGAFPAWAATMSEEIGMSTITVKSRGTVTVDVETCKGCELCIPACPPNVLTMSEGVNRMGFHWPELHPGCTGCAACLLVCPDFVFEVFRYTEPVLHQFEEGAQ